MGKIKAAWHNVRTHQKVWALTLPMVLSNISVPLVGTVDTMVVGHLDDASNMAAVGVGSSIYVLLVAALNFLRMGTTGFTAQASGRNDGEKLRQILFQGIVLAFGLAAFLSLFAYPFSQGAFAIMQPSPELHSGASSFFYWRLLGLPAALLNFTLVGWFLGVQNARVPLYILLATNIVNMVLTVLFVLYLKWGVVGAAQAAIIAEWIGAGVGLFFLSKILNRLPGRWNLTPLKKWAKWRPLLFVNRDIFIRSLTLHIAFFLVTIQGTRLGDNTVAANMIILNGLLLMSHLLDGFAHAIESLCGRAIGRKDRTELMETLIVAGGWGLLISVGFFLLFLAGGRYFIDLLSNIESVRKAAYPLIPFLVVLPLVSVWSYLLDGLFIGATRAKEMRNAMLLSFLIAFPLGILLTPLGNAGLWIAFLTFMACRGVIMGWITYRIDHGEGWV